MSKKTIWLLVLLVVIAAFLGGYFYFQKIWWPKRQAAIQAGLAESKFPWRAYTQEELNKMYPQIRYADVPTRVTPEQTYANFREALRTNNLEMALEQLAVEAKTYKDNKTSIEKAYKEGKFKELYKEYLEAIQKEYIAESIAQFYFLEKKNNEITRYSLNFTKDANGDWKMDSL